MPIALAVHGGAWNIPDDAVEPSRDGVRAAATAAWDMLRDGAPALDVVERAVRLLEDDPHFDAGVGSRLTSDAEVELDASIMDGRDLRGGAVAAVRGLRHPVSVARLVMERSPHVMLVGDGARRFAVEHGAETCRTEDLLVGRERERYLRVRAGESWLVEREFDPDAGEGPLGTVGAVAVDREGHVAAATSTGGTQDKAPGRVGDTPILGAGTYADDRLGAASSTGHGEPIMRVLLARTALAALSAGADPARAAASALATLGEVGGKGGLLVVDPAGRIGIAFTTPRMARAWADDGGVRAAVDRHDAAP